MKPPCDPFFSIVILARSGLHLLPLTLETIKSQSEQDFEVVIVASPQQGIAQLYPELRVFQAKGKEIAEMMNEGIRVAKGRYLQFLDPGDRFLSHQGLSYLRQLIQDSHEPHLVYSGFLMRGPDEPPRAVTFPFNQEILKKGLFPNHFRSSWFRRDSLQDLGGFDKMFSYRPAFDSLCRLYQKKDLKVVCSRRVLTDSESHSSTPWEMVGYVVETCRILYRHFGLLPALRWIFVQDHLKMLKWTALLVKQAFWKS
jgi:glycosyltransferase involved in cell wall biosynthesis